MDRQQQGNLLIAAGVLAGLGTVAYWLMNGGWEQVKEAVTGEAATPEYLPEATGPLPGQAVLGPSAAVTPSLVPSPNWLPAAATAPSAFEARYSERGY